MDKADGACPPQRLICESAGPSSGFLGEASAANRRHDGPGDFAAREAFGRPQAGPADEGGGDFVLEDPMPVATQRPMAKITGHAAPRLVAGMHAANVARFVGVGVNRGEGLEVHLLPTAQPKPLSLEDRDHFFFPPNGLKPPPKPGSFAPPPSPGKCGGRLKAPGGGAAGMPGGPDGAPGSPAPPSCFCIASICSGDGIGMPPPSPIIWPSLPIMPRLAPPPPMAFIMSAIWRCCLRSRLTYSTVTPEPAAMRFLREALRMSGLRRSCGVIDEMMARWRLTNLSSRLAELSWSLILATPGSMPMMPPIPPSFSICDNCSERSLRSKTPLRIFSAILAACATSIFCAAFSTRLTMSPMPRMRSARRAGWKSSIASIFSPTPSSLIGLPVTERIDNGAAPRAPPPLG